MQTFRKTKVNSKHVEIARELIAAHKNINYPGKLLEFMNEYGTDFMSIVGFAISALAEGAINPVEVWTTVGWKEKQEGN